MPVFNPRTIIQFGDGDLCPTVTQEVNAPYPTSISILQLDRNYEVGQQLVDTSPKPDNIVAILDFKNIRSLEVVMQAFQQLHEQMSAGIKNTYEFTEQDIPMTLIDGVLAFSFESFFDRVNLVNPQQMTFDLLEQHLSVLLQHVYAQHVFATDANLPLMKQALAHVINKHLLDVFIVKKQ